MSNIGDPEAVAAEYVLGTLNSDDASRRVPCSPRTRRLQPG